MNFIALHINTANQWPDSVCHISLAKVVNHQVVDTLDTYIQTNETFDVNFVAKHGIEQADVQHSPTFQQFSTILTNWLQNETVICFYAPFEQLILEESYDANQLIMPKCTFKSMLPALKQQISKLERPTLLHSAHLLLTSCPPTEGEMIASLVLEQNLNVDLSVTTASSQQATVTSLVNETVVFTGGLQNLTRSMAATLVRRNGGMFSNSITKHTSILVISALSEARFNATAYRSSKWLKALALQQSGQALQIINEKTFKQLIGMDS